jgi:hypothetical protein
MSANWKESRTSAAQVPVDQIDLETGEVVHRYATVLDAASAMGGRYTTILSVMNHKTADAYGFSWRKYNGADIEDCKSFYACSVTNARFTDDDVCQMTRTIDWRVGSVLNSSMPCGT